MKARIQATDEGMVNFTFPMQGAAEGGSMNLTADQAEHMAHALLLQAYVARGNTPSEQQFRAVRGMVLR